MLLHPSSPQAIRETLALLATGGVIVHATETCYGLACDLTNPAAVARLFAIKKRPLTQPVSALFTSLEQAKEYVAWNEEADALAKKYLPGPLTIILPLHPAPPQRLYPTPPSGQRSAVSGQHEKKSGAHNLPLIAYRLSLGVRLSSHPLAQSLVQSFGRPLSTTSANIHGETNPYDAQEIFKRFQGEPEQPDLILDSGVLPPVPPSTVVDLTRGGKMVRRGDICNDRKCKSQKNNQ